MCGIVGIIAKTTKLPHYADDLFTQMLMMDTVRGADSTGAFGVCSKGAVDLIKGNTDGYTFVTSEGYKKFEKRIFNEYAAVIGHNRKATKGTVTAENAHPFKVEHITLVHNGTIRNAATLNKEVEVDSHAIAHSLSEHDCATALSKIDGAYALIWYDQKDQTMNIARNAERPLYIIEYENCYILSSEAGLALWLQGRESRKHKDVKLVPTDKIIAFDMKNLHKGYYEVPYEEYKTWTAPIVSSYKHTPWQNPYGSHNTMKNYGPKPMLEEFDKKHFPAYKSGERIKFKLASYNDDTCNDSVLLGHPILETTEDRNIHVRCMLMRGETVSDYLEKGDLFTAEILHFRLLNGSPTYFVKDVKQYSTVKNSLGEELDASEVERNMQLGCPRCHGDMLMKDLNESLVKKSASGRWRMLCKTCLSVAMVHIANSPKPDEDEYKYVQ